MKRRHFLRAIGAAGLCSLVVDRESAAQHARRFEVRLSATPRDTSMRSQVAGHGSVEATLEGRLLTVTGAFEGLKSNATRAEIHMGPATAVRGPAIYRLDVSGGMAGTIEGSVALGDEALQGLAAGLLYIQLDSASAPEGNLWGWLLEESR